MAEKIEVRLPEVSFDLVIGDNVPDIYVDGVANLALGIPISRLTFFTVQPGQPGESPSKEAVVEKRKAVLNMAIPTGPLIELCANIIRGAAQNQAELAGGSRDATEKFVSMLDSMTAFSKPPKSE